MLKRLSLALICLLILSPAGSALAFDAGPQPDLAGWWPFDEMAGTTAYDASGNGNDGVFVGDPQWVPGILGGALEFNGDDYLNCGRGESLNIRDQITIAFWLQVQAFTNNWEAFLAKGEGAYRASRGGETGNGTHMGISGTSVGGGNGYFNGTVIITGGEWHHYASTYDGAEGRIYIDGVLDVASPGTGQIGDSSSSDLYIGDNSGATGRLLHGLLDDVRLYSRALPIDEILIVMAGYGGNMAINPRPADEAIDVPRDVVLAWDPMETATTRDVYFGTAFDDVNDATRANPMDVLLSQGQTATTFDPPGLLDFGQTYYWRIDEVNAPPDSTVFKGEVWSFTAEPFAYPVQNIIAVSNGLSDEGSTPQQTVDGSGLNAADQHSTEAADMWVAYAPDDEPLYIQYEFDRVYKLHEMLVWNYNVQFELLLGFGLKDVTVEYSVDGEEWTALGDFTFARATAKAMYAANTTVPFDGVPVKFVRLNVNSAYGTMGQYGLSEVRFLFIPAQAREPEPGDGATGVDVTTALSWRAGRDAASYDVYLAGDPNELALVGTTADVTLSPSDIEFGSTYYWMVDAINPDDANPTWGSSLWSFSTQEYALVDGFETYNDDLDAGTAIFDTWLDGWVNNTGSTVGYIQTPFAEKTIVHGGMQSMPLQYDNGTSPFYSEAERQFDSPQNWSGNGADTLVLYVRGNAPAFKETADGVIMSAVGTDIWGTVDQFRYAYKSLNGNGSITVRVDSVIRSNEWAKAGVMIRETLEAGSKHAFVALTPEPTHGASLQRRPVAGTDSANTDVADISLPYWARLTRTNNLFTAQISADGVTWVDITPTDPVEIPMTANVYIGLAVTSHDAAITTAAEFSNLAMTGSVTGAWQTADIGATQPTGNDSADPMYVRIEDSAGQSVTIVNPDAAITLRPTWQEWSIPYTDLAGVNLARIQTMVIGVGSKTSPTAGGAGTVYVDDVGFGRPFDSE